MKESEGLVKNSLVENCDSQRDLRKKMTRRYLADLMTMFSRKTTTIMAVMMIASIKSDVKRTIVIPNGESIDGLKSIYGII